MTDERGSTVGGREPMARENEPVAGKNEPTTGLLSVVIPAFNEEAMVVKTNEVISGILKDAQIDFEIIFVDDGSKDDTWRLIKTIHASSPATRGIHFSRNFGKESAIYAGLAHAKGACAVVIDCDLQHPPEKIVEMYRLWQEGYEIVEAVKASRGEESFLHAVCAKWFYNLISAATKIDMSRASDFKLLDRKAVAALLNMGEKNTFFRALSSWIGFCSVQIEFEVQERVAGASKWSAKALVKYALSNITSFTALPMQLVTILGGILFVVSVVLSVIALVQKAMGEALGGFTTVIILLAFSSSVIMIALGIIGYYIAKIYDEIKGRPKYIVSEECGGEKVVK